MSGFREAFVGLLLLSGCARPGSEITGQSAPVPVPRLHHVGLNSVDPERAIAWYLGVWPSAKRTVVGGRPGVEGEMVLLFTTVDRPPRGMWRHDLQRSEPQSAFWHIGAFTNTTDLRARLTPLGIEPLPLFTSPTDSIGVWRSGLASSPPRDGGFSYVVAPDGVLFELTGGPTTRDAFSHIHLFHSRPLCAANWYVEQLGMTLPPLRDSAGVETARPRWDPCDVAMAEPTWPSLERTGTSRQPVAGVRFGNGALSWYPRADLAPTRGQALDHLAFTVSDFDGLVARLRRAGVAIVDGPYPFGDSRAVMIEGPDRLAIELIDAGRG